MHQMTASPVEFLTTKELMNFLKIKHKQTIYQLIREGMPTFSIGKSYRFDLAEVVYYLKQISKKKRAKETPQSTLK